MGDIIKPPALRPGDRVGIIAPASNIDAEHLKAGIATLERMGYLPEYELDILDEDVYFAGSLERRIREFHHMYERDEIKAVLCARGGYGANYLLPHLRIDLIQAHQKIFIGYSDVTCLLTYLQDAIGMVTFHGPMVTKDFAIVDGIHENSWQYAVSGTREWEVNAGEALAPGQTEGVLYGGCLSMIVSSLGTPYEALTEGKLLFLEDIAAKPYQIDRMLMQLKLAGKFKEVKGIVFGEMLNCVQSPDQPYTLQEMILRIVEDLNVPIAYGLKSGHVSSGNVTLPFGLRARLSASSDTARLQILESAVAI